MGQISLISEVAEKIKQKLVQANIPFDNVGFDQITRRDLPTSFCTADIAIKSGTFEKLHMNTRALNLSISIYLLINNLRSEGAGRFKIYDLIDGVTRYLILSDLGLQLVRRVDGSSFNDITDDDFLHKGYTLYELMFDCKICFEEKSEDECVNDLLKIIGSVYVNDDEPQTQFQIDFHKNYLDFGIGDTANNSTYAPTLLQYDDWFFAAKFQQANISSKQYLYRDYVSDNSTILNIGVEDGYVFAELTYLGEAIQTYTSTNLLAAETDHSIVIAKRSNGLYAYVDNYNIDETLLTGDFDYNESNNIVLGEGNQGLKLYNAGIGYQKINYIDAHEYINNGIELPYITRYSGDTLTQKYLLDEIGNYHLTNNGVA